MRSHWERGRLARGHCAATLRAKVVPSGKQLRNLCLIKNIYYGNQQRKVWKTPQGGSFRGIETLRHIRCEHAHRRWRSGIYVCAQLIV